MKLFGLSLFGYKNPPVKMYDFAQHGLNNPDSLYGYVTNTDLASIKAKKEKEKPVLTPKEVYNLKSLNDNDFKINTGEEYIQEQIKVIDEKIKFLGKKPKEKKDKHGFSYSSEPMDTAYGRDELESIKERLINRQRINDFKKIVDKYPHTSSTLISKVLEEHKELSSRPAEAFVPDFPRDAIQAMKEYDDMCIKICNKKAVFYVIANNRDFQQKNKRRDPILLAQSPFGHFWQILGAWDEEMIFLGDL